VADEDVGGDEGAWDLGDLLTLLAFGDKADPPITAAAVDGTKGPPPNRACSC
jgi:hypothetical protein